MIEGRALTVCWLRMCSSTTAPECELLSTRFAMTLLPGRSQSRVSIDHRSTDMPRLAATSLTVRLYAPYGGRKQSGVMPIVSCIAALVLDSSSATAARDIRARLECVNEWLQILCPSLTVRCICEG